MGGNLQVIELEVSFEEVRRLTLARSIMNFATKPYVEKPVTTPAEQKLIDAAMKGEVADFTTNAPAADDPAKGIGWAAERTIRAQVLRTLCLGSNPKWVLDPRGIRVVGARIVGALDMESASVPVPLYLWRCSVEQNINFLDASTRTISLEGSHVLSLCADRAVIKGGLFLSNGFKATGAVRLGGAEIGSLDCSDARLENPGGDALFADQLKAANYVFFRNCSARGEVRLPGAQIGGTLDCGGAAFVNPSGTALNAQRVRTGKDVFLRNRFRAEGGVSLIGAEIGGDLDCHGATFTGALVADQIKTGGKVVLKSACSEGAVRFLGAVIGTDLDCDGATLKNAGADVLSIEGATISGALRWRLRPPIGGVVFAQAKVGRLVDDPQNWPEPGKLVLDGFVYGSFAGKGPTELRTRLKWLDSQPKDRFWPQPYAQLARVLEAMGQERDARAVAIAKEEAFIKYGNASWRRRCWLHFLGMTVGYGYKPGRVLWWLLALVIVGGIIFWCADNQAAIVPVKEATATSAAYPRNGELPSGYPRFYPFIYSLDVALPIIDLKQDRYWAPNQDTLPGRVAQWWLWVEILFGWILVTVGVAAITGIIKKH